MGKRVSSLNRIAICLAAIFLASPAWLPEACALRKSPRVRKVVLKPTEMLYGDSLRTGVPFSKDPTVIRKGKVYYMYYTIPAYSEDRTPDTTAYLENGFNAAIARSRDGIHWERVGDLDLRDTHGQRIWGAVAPCVKRFGGRIHLFYQRKWEDAHGNNNIWHAVSRDGITFTNTCDEPVFIPRTYWSIDRSIDAEVYRVGKKLILMYATRDTAARIQMLGMAEAPYRSDYGPEQWTLLSTDGPLLQPDHPWEMSCIEAPTVIRHKGVWYMFYAGAYNHEHQQIGLATSTDGIHYRRIAPDGLVYPSGPEGSWNAYESGHPGVFRDRDGQVYLYYQGKSSLKGNYRLSTCKVSFR